MDGVFLHGTPTGPGTGPLLFCVGFRSPTPLINLQHRVRRPIQDLIPPDMFKHVQKCELSAKRAVGLRLKRLLIARVSISEGFVGIKAVFFNYSGSEIKQK